MYPKVKCQGVEIKQGQHHTENPGFICEKVASPEEEAALGEGWYDTPREALDAFAAAAAKAPTPETKTQPEAEPARPTEEWPLENERAEKRRRR